MISTETRASHRNRLSLVQLFNVTNFCQDFLEATEKNQPSYTKSIDKNNTKTSPRPKTTCTKQNNKNSTQPRVLAENPPVMEVSHVGQQHFSTKVPISLKKKKQRRQVDHIETNMGVSENGGFSPQIIHFKKGFPLFSLSILGYPYFWKHPFKMI